MKIYTWIIALGFFATMASCKPTGYVQCETDASCNAGVDGQCLQNPSTGNQWCSYPDVACTSGFRWSDLDVGDSLGGVCVARNVIDQVPPEVIARTPEPDAQLVSPTVVLSITFSEDIAPSSVNAQSVLLREDIGGRVVPIRLTTRGSLVVLHSDSPLDPRRSYRISITTAIQDLAGNGLTRDVSWTFQTREASWKQQIPLEAKVGMGAGVVDAGAGGGVVMAAWEFLACAPSCEFIVPTEIWVAVRKGDVWAQELRIGASSTGAFSPRVAVDSTGRGLVLWIKRGGDGSSYIMSSRYDGLAWQAPVVMASLGPAFPSGLELLVDGGGNAFALWRLEGGTLHASKYTPTDGWGTPSRIDLADSPVAGFGLETQSTDKAVAVWWQAGRLRSRRYESGAWAALTDGPETPQISSVSLAAQGDDVTVVGQTSSSLLVSRFVGAAWEAAVRLDDPTAPASQVAEGRGLHYLSSGTLFTTWTVGNDAKYALRRPGQGWERGTVLEPFNDMISSLRVSVGGTRALVMFRVSELNSTEFDSSIGWKGTEGVPLTTGAIGRYVLVYDTSSNTFVAIFAHRAPGSEMASVYSKTYQ